MTSGIPPRKTGLQRLVAALTYSVAGIKAAFASETAFRQDVLLCVVLGPLAFFVGKNPVEIVLLLLPLFLLLIAELVNTAIETVIERISPEWHIYSKKAKDIGSAVVFLSLIFLATSWGMIIFG